MNRARIASVAIVLAISVGATSASAQSTADEILKSTTEYIRETESAETISLDPSILAGEEDHQPSLQPARATERNSWLAASASVRLLPRSEAIECEGARRSTCRVIGLHLTASEPIAQGASATVIVRIIKSTESRRRPLFIRDVQFSLVREGEVWKVTRAQPLRIT